MDTLGIIFTVILVIAAILAGMYFLGRYLQKKQNESQQLIDQNRQKITAYIIDKKKAKVSEANFPKSVMEQMPKRLKFFKMPLVKIKSGPQIMTMFCDEGIFDLVPVKKEIKAEVSGMYLVGVKGVHGTKIQKETKKKSKFKQWVEKMQEKAGAKPLK